MKKCAKIVCVYFGQRRTLHGTPGRIHEFLKNKFIPNELNIENEFPTDVIFVVNGGSSSIALEECQAKETKNGKIIVSHRENRGGSFGAYYWGFLRFQHYYDYWFFCEDDVLIYKQGYIRKFIEFLDSDENLGFVALAPIAHGKNPHSGGGCGLTSTKKLLRSRSEKCIEDYLTNAPEETHYHVLERAEVEFTGIFAKKGMKIANHPEFCPSCSNPERHQGQSKFVQSNLEKIYSVGE